MSEFYRGSTPTLIFTPNGTPSGTPHVTLTQGEVRIAPAVSRDGNKYRVTLTSAQTSAFKSGSDVSAQLYFETANSFEYMPVHYISVKENYYDFQEDAVADEDLDPVYGLMNPYETDNPSALGWYELSGDTYRKTSDTSPVTGKDYFVDVAAMLGVREVPMVSDASFIAIESVESYDIPEDMEWYEMADGVYFRSTDRSVVGGKTYYVIDRKDDYEDEYDLFAKTFDGAAFATDNGLDTDFEDDLSTQDWDPWDAAEEFSSNPNIDNYAISYNAVQPTGVENPVNEAWLELIDGEYEFTTDTYVEPGKVYYDVTFSDPEA